jgi:GH15 family glucan-1,4-alpha-glucosidase
MLVAFDDQLGMRDFFFPFVGQWNHIQGSRNMLGIWTEGRFSWLDNDGWRRTLAYLPETMVTDCQATNEEVGLSLSINDAVHFSDDIYLKKVRLTNLTARGREVRVFFTHDFSIDETDVGDTALYDPRLHAVVHYKKRRYLLVNGFAGRTRIHQYACGTKRFKGAEGTWRDAEDGELSGNPIAQGSVDSTISFRLYLQPSESQDVYYWIVAGRNNREVLRLNEMVLETGPTALLDKIAHYWRTWVNSVPVDFGDLPGDISGAYKRSLLTVRTHVDRGGAVLAAADSDILETNRDHYCYMWPRDGALVVYSLLRAGYGKTVRSFFSFCADALTEGGYLLHKYNPDGTLGSSWHPWIYRGQTQLPIQEDETALVLWVLWEYFRREGDMDFALEYYHSLVRPIGDFLSGYFDEALELPRDSYDLWEERRGIFTFTASAVFAGLSAGANFAALLGENDVAREFRDRAQQIKRGILGNLFDQDAGRFVRGLTWDYEKGEYRKDPTMESSVAGIFTFGVLDAAEDRVTATMEAMEKGLWVRTAVGGLARYHNDYYFQKSRDLARVPGNPWYVSTQWLVQWYIARAASLEDLEKPREVLQWAAKYALPTGIMPEQVHPENGAPLSVAPLTWSHSSFILSVVAYVEKYRELNVACEPATALPVPAFFGRTAAV